MFKTATLFHELWGHFAADSEENWPTPLWLVIVLLPQVTRRKRTNPMLSQASTPQEPI